MEQFKKDLVMSSLFHRIVEVGRGLWRSSSPDPVTQSRLPRTVPSRV